MREVEPRRESEQLEQLALPARITRDPPGERVPSGPATRPGGKVLQLIGHKMPFAIGPGDIQLVASVLLLAT